MKTKPYKALNGAWVCGGCILQVLHRNELKCKRNMRCLEEDDFGNVKANCKGEV